MRFCCGCEKMRALGRRALAAIARRSGFSKDANAFANPCCADRPQCGMPRAGRGGMRKAASVGDYRALAKARLPHFLFEYIDGGSYDEVTLRRNVADLQAVALRQRVLRDVSALDLATELFGE